MIWPKSILYTVYRHPKGLLILALYEKSPGIQICVHYSEWNNLYFETFYASLAYQIAKKPLCHFHNYEDNVNES